MEVAVVTLAVIGAGTLAQRYRGPKGKLRRRRMRTRFLHKFRRSKKGMKDPQLQRDIFAHIPMVTLREPTAHTHPLQAKQRNEASATLVQAAKEMCCEPYLVQMSKPDQRKGYDGCKDWSSVKHLTASPQSMNPTMEHAIVVVDNDFHVNMRHLLMENFGRPILLYTLTPTSAAADEGEYSFRFNSDNEVEFTVSGGGQYKHHVWDWGHDTIMVKKKFLGITYATVAYMVDRRQAGKHHSLISLTPLARWRGLPAWLSTRLDHVELEHLRPVNGNLVRLNVQTQEGMQVSVSTTELATSMTMAQATFDAIWVTAKHSVGKVTLASIVGYIDDDLTINEKRQCAAPALDYFRQKVQHKGALVYSVSDSVRVCDFGVSHPDTDSKPLLEPFMSPIMNEAFTGRNNLATEKAGIEGRITNIQHGKVIPVTNFSTKCIEEFANHMFPLGPTLHPVTEDEVTERQPRPAQRSIIQRAAWELGRRITKTFIKAEAYQAPKDPRVISTINGPDKVAYSQYIYAFSDHLKTYDWYAFGKTPREIAERVATLVTNARHNVVESDVSRMDGRKASTMHFLEKVVINKAFGREYLPELHELRKSQYGIQGKGKFGTKFDVKWTQISGSPHTSAFNTIDTAYTVYETMRRTRKPNGLFMSPTEAWNALGMYGGDDGLTADIDHRTYEKTGALLGAKITTEPKRREDRPRVSFLSRQYGPGVWDGAPDSTCDIPRQLAKFHVTPRLNAGVTPQDKLVEKCRATKLSDAETPVLGEYVTKFLELNGGLMRDNARTALRIWNGDHDMENHYPNKNTDGWMDDYMDETLPKFDREQFSQWVSQLNTLEEALSPPLCVDVKPAVTKVAVIVDDMHLPGAPQKQDATVYGPKCKDGGMTAPVTRDQEEEKVAGKQRPKRPLVKKPRSTDTRSRAMHTPPRSKEQGASAHPDPETYKTRSSQQDDGSGTGLLAAIKSMESKLQPSGNTVDQAKKPANPKPRDTPGQRKRRKRKRRNKTAKNGTKQ
jgi:hypothetical protein